MGREARIIPPPAQRFRSIRKRRRPDTIAAIIEEVAAARVGRVDA